MQCTVGGVVLRTYSPDQLIHCSINKKPRNIKFLTGHWFFHSGLFFAFSPFHSNLQIPRWSLQLVISSWRKIQKYLLNLSWGFIEKKKGDSQTLLKQARKARRCDSDLQSETINDWPTEENGEKCSTFSAVWLLTEVSAQTSGSHFKVNTKQ